MKMMDDHAVPIFSHFCVQKLSRISLFIFPEGAPPSSSLTTSLQWATSSPRPPPNQQLSRFSFFCSVFVEGFLFLPINISQSLFPPEDPLFWIFCYYFLSSWFEPFLSSCRHHSLRMSLLQGSSFSSFFFCLCFLSGMSCRNTPRYRLNQGGCKDWWRLAYFLTSPLVFFFSVFCNVVCVCVLVIRDHPSSSVVEVI